MGVFWLLMLRGLVLAELVVVALAPVLPSLEPKAA